jgi:hypothetical protein
MKYVVTLISWILFTAYAFGGEVIPGLLRPEARKELLARRNSDGLAAEALVPDDKNGTPVPLSSLDQGMMNVSFEWIRRVIKPEWLPAGFESNVIALKQTALRENTILANGLSTGTWPTDYFLLQYSMKGYQLHVLESGLGVCLRVDLPVAGANSIHDLKSEIVHQLAQFLSIPPSASIWKELEFSERGSLTYVARIGEFPPQPRGEFETRNWWEGLQVYTDGTFFFVSVPEIRPGPNHVRAQAGPPNRF